ncbi:hypothetical protein G6F35_009855 [Rhizopus arrhizus]|nr:hypothetical protein G6F35_009855 [Rhizopus arrhizus]
MAQRIIDSPALADYWRAVDSDVPAMRTARETVRDLLEAPIARAKAAGLCRADLEKTDISLISGMLGAALRGKTRDERAQLAGRALQLLRGAGSGLGGAREADHARFGVDALASAPSTRGLCTGVAAGGDHRRPRQCAGHRQPAVPAGPAGADADPGQLAGGGLRDGQCHRQPAGLQVPPAVRHPPVRRDRPGPVRSAGGAASVRRQFRDHPADPRRQWLRRRRLFDTGHAVHAAGAAAPLHRQPAGGGCGPFAAGGADCLDCVTGAGRYRPVAPALLIRSRPRPVRVRGGGGAEAAARHPDQGLRADGLPHLRPARPCRCPAGDRAGTGLYALVAGYAVAGVGTGRLHRVVHHRLHHRTLPPQPAAADALAGQPAGAALHRGRVPDPLPDHRAVLRRGQPDAC